MIGLRGRTAIVTGASRGIGLEIARQLVDSGANVCITARSREALDEAAASLAADDRVLTVAGNSADPDHRASAVGTVMAIPLIVSYVYLTVALFSTAKSATWSSMAVAKLLLLLKTTI